MIKVRSAETVKGILTLTIEVPVSDFAPYLTEAAKAISKVRIVPGFRPGNATLEAVTKEVGQMAVLEEAAETMVSRTFYQAIKEQSFVTVGAPKISVEMLAPDNPFVYTATVSLLPTVTLGDLSSVKVEKREVKIEDKEVEGVLQELAKMQTQEKKVEREVMISDRVVVDMDMSQNNVAVEGGSARDHHIYLAEKHYIPGLAESIVGMKQDEEKKFALKFPAEHYQKNLAGQDVDIKVKVKEIHEQIPPVVDDEFAKKLGQTDMVALKNLLRKNIEDDKNKKERDREEHAMLEELVKISKFSDIPEDLVVNEVGRMLEEVEDQVRHQGGEFQAYLDSIKKTKEQLMIDFAPQAVERVKAALLLHTIATDNSLNPTEEEVHQYIEDALKQYPNNKEALENAKSPEMHEHVTTMLRNRKAIEWIKNKADAKV